MDLHIQKIKIHFKLPYSLRVISLGWLLFFVSAFSLRFHKRDPANGEIVNKTKSGDVYIYAIIDFKGTVRQ